MSKILFVEEKLRIDKLGILYLSAILKKAGHEVELIQDKVDDFDKFIIEYKPDFIMYSVLTGNHHWYIQKNRELKNKYKFTSVVGGPHFTFSPEDAENDPFIDYCVIGPGEEAILEIINGKAKEKIIKGHLLDDVDIYPEPDRTILYKYEEFGKSPVKRFMAGRDCPNACKYCFNHIYHKLYSDERNKFFQIRNVDKIIQEVVDTKNRYGLELAFFNDDDFTMNHKWVNEFCEKFKERAGVSFGISIRANNVNEEILKKLSNAGCTTLRLSIETSNPETQKFLRRGNINNQQIINACEYSKKYGIEVKVQNMIGLPIENPLEDALETLEFNQKLNVKNSACGIFQPFPKTDLWKYCIDNKLLDENAEIRMHEEDTVLKIKNAKEINALNKWWYFAIKYKLPIELIKILIKQEFNKEVDREIINYTWKELGKNFYNLKT